MSQIDKLTFIPHLFWFIILFLIFYFLIFSYILPMIFQSLKVREFFFFTVVNSVFFKYIFYFVIFSLQGDTFFINFVRDFFCDLKFTYDIRYSRARFYFSSLSNVVFL